MVLGVVGRRVRMLSIMAYHVSQQSRRNPSNQEKERGHREPKVRSVEQPTRLPDKGLTHFLCLPCAKGTLSLKVTRRISRKLNVVVG